MTDGGGTDGGGTTTDGGGTTTDGGGTTTDGGGTTTDGGGTTTGFTCTTGTLLAGHPAFDADPGVHANEGDPLTGVEGRPLGFREVIFVGTHLVTVVGGEVWSSDLSAATPTVHRIAGNAADRALLDGPCAGARFANLQDVVADAAGALYVMDQTGNAILQITDPFDPATCAVHYWAGTSVDHPDIDINRPPNIGDTDGPGLSAQFGLPAKMAIGPDGALYVWDDENDSIRRIAADPSHTVSTLTGIIFSVTTSGVVTRVAGEERTDSGSFDSDYDPAASHPASELQLANRAQYATAGAPAWLVFHEGSLYYVGQEHDPYVERITCSR